MLKRFLNREPALTFLQRILVLHLVGIVSSLASTGCAVEAAAQISVHSPDSNVVVDVDVRPLSYSVTYKGQQVIASSPLGLELKGQTAPNLLRVIKGGGRTEDTTTKPVWGKTASIRNHFNELTLSSESSDGVPKLGLIVRAYDDGVAFRYTLPAGAGQTSFVLSRELTGVRFPGDPIVWATIYPAFHHSSEQHYVRQHVSDLSTDLIVGLPLLAEVRPNVYAAVAEADLTDWAGMSLKPTNDGLMASLSPRLDGNGLVAAALPHDSPWRVIMLGSTPGALIESSLIENLSPPSAIADTSWIHPGKTAWDHWWSGDTKADTQTIERYIAFASEMGFPYQLIDWEWYGNFNEPTTDIMKPKPSLDWAGILQFAKDHHVREWLWIHSTDINHALEAGKLDDVFALYEKWGIAGVKIDFMDSDDQAMVNWYIRVVQMAAAHHLMVDYHGAFKDTGLRVTYPNLLTREGVLGNEYNKFSSRVTPTHKLTLPFTRMLVGPMDYTPGGFLNRSPAEWKKTNPTEVMGSRAQELALFVVYWSALTCVTDDPEHYHNQPGLDFLREVPTVWDETKVLDGVVGEHIVMARRSGQRWFVGGMTGDQPYTYQLPLGFLGRGTYTVHIFADPTDPKASYEELSQSTRKVTSKDTLTLPMREAGGAALYFEPAN